MRRFGQITATLWLLATPLAALAAEPKYEVVVKKAFINNFKDRTSIAAKMLIRHSHPYPNPVGEKSKDGDLHFSGESPDVGLPFVAEVVNAWQQDDAVQFIKKTADHNEKNPNGMVSIEVTGAWRLWFEHPSKRQVQGDDNPFEPDDTNPAHSFEIHPVSNVGSFDVHDSFGPVWKKKANPPAEFIAYPATTAFPYFDKAEMLIKASGSGVAMRSKRLVYNYVQFVMELTQKPKQVDDGYIALARVLNAEDEPQSDEEHRMIFVEGTDGAQVMKTAKSGAEFHVLGIPRIDLDAVLALIKTHGTEEFRAKLPYEMIIVGIYAN